jgi:hypothetical protein
MLLCVVILSSYGCDKTSEVKKGTIQGSVVLDGEADHSGITVLLYVANVVSQELKMINQDYPSIGLQFDSRHTFDHRIQTPFAQTTTDSTGVFSFETVLYGEYIIAYYKDGWGFDYVFDVVLASSLYYVSADFDYSLHQVSVLPQTVDGDYVFENDRCYVAEQDITFLPNSNVTFMGRSKLLIGAGSSVVIHGNAVFNSNRAYMATITSYSNVYSHLSEPLPFTRLVLTNNSHVESIQGLSLSLSSDGLVIQTSGTSVSNSIFQLNDSSLNVINGGNAVIESCAFIDGKGSKSNAVFFFGSVNSCAMDNIFWNNKISVTIHTSEYIEVKNNIFIDGVTGVLNSFQSSSTLENNTFRNLSHAIANTALSNLELYHNDIESQICVYTYHSPNMGNVATQGWTKANYNNFIASQNAVKSMGYFYNQGVNVVLDFKSNYWNTSSSSLIAESILDYHDLLPPNDSYVVPIIEFSPFQNARIAAAGVQ